MQTEESRDEYLHIISALEYHMRDVVRAINDVTDVMNHPDTNYSPNKEVGFRLDMSLYEKEWSPAWLLARAREIKVFHRQTIQKYGSYKSREYWHKGGAHKKSGIPGEIDIVPKNKKEALEYMEQIKSYESYVSSPEYKELQCEIERKQADKASWAKKQGGYVYVARAEDGLYKIGLSKNPERRMKEIGRQGEDVELVIKIKTNHMRRLESALHDKYKKKRCVGEWYKLSIEDINRIKNKYPKNSRNFRK